MREHQHISRIYGTLLVIEILLCICGLFYIPIDTYSVNSTTADIELSPSDIISQSDDVREYYFRGVDWESKGTCLHFNSSHHEISVEADGVLIFERKAVKTIWGRTPGYSWEYINIPVNTKLVTVTLTACYPSVRDVSIRFYQGFGADMYYNLLHNEGFNAIISLFDVCLGLILLIIGSAVRRKSDVGGAMVYLGIFTGLLGVWSLSENGIVAILIENRAISSYISYTTLALVGIPLVMFVRCYLKLDEKYMCRIILGFNVINITQMHLFQMLGILDMKQTLSMTHIAMVASVLYLPYSLIFMLRYNQINRRFWVAVASTLSLAPPVALSLYKYYIGAHNVNSYGNVFVFMFIIIFAVDVSITIMKDIDAGKKAAIYQELAEKDLLTDCYNRNAYRNDTKQWTDLNDVMLVTCDLNNLKQCNDSLGHAYGDQYIIDSATILKKIFSNYGKVYRIGGDEFCIIIPDEHSCNIENLIDALNEEERKYNDTSAAIHLEIAYGYADFEPSTDSNLEDIRIRADGRMYNNKRELKKMRFV